jgi:hypothetical protein
MQFIPSTWAMYGIDGNDDRVASPFNINDAALAAARYLCAAGGDLATAAGRSRAVLAYNHSDEYLALVLGTAAAYAHGTSLDAPIRGAVTGTLPPVDTSWLPPVNPGSPIGVRSGSVTTSSGSRSPGAATSGSGSSGSGSSSTATSGSGSSGTGSSGTGTSGTGTSGTGSSGSGSGGSASGTGSAGSSHPAPGSSAAAEPTPTASSNRPVLPGVPLPSVSNPVAQPAPTSSTICTRTVLGIVVEIPCIPS